MSKFAEFNFEDLNEIGEKINPTKFIFHNNFFPLM